MVGVPTSKGCSTCRTRSIKCDEARPSCSQCRRGGRKCPGYRIRSKFVDESAKFQAEACRKTSRDVPSGSNVGSLNMLSLTGFRSEFRSLEREGIVATFVQDLFPIGRLTVQHSFIGSWLWHIPQILHKNRPIDLAAESLALAYFAKKASSNEMLIRSRNTYANALRSLSNAVLDHRSRFTSETLCAALLLVHFENFVTIGGKSWITHTGGVGRLIEIRGPHRHCTGLDNAMLMASRGYLISQAVATGTGCFLDGDEWKNIRVHDTNFPLMPRNYDIYHEGLNYFANIPGLMKNFKRRSSGDLSVHHALIYSEAKNVRSAMVEWFAKLQSNARLPIRILLPLPPGPHIIFPSIYEYRDIVTATFVVNYSAYLLQVNNMLDSLENSNHYLADNISLSKDICMSAAYCSRGGFCGTQAMAHALPLALSALPECYAGWIQRQINVFERVRESFTLRSAFLADEGITKG
ncbi:hypothetical protein BCR34DRAFT_114221 [Clohesyomyces aquaticus]|uniref:Zn(2)-C6 fungal-type domain-containing protein n=1 Tax=Clohesyomyces aquaticus TaxID=1231657 RepID=A0A1Y1YQI9_9PLEO|nr:hypothetical protein BCR34DRAFT_114221 [Clohesyomyces aquaticus]